MTFEVVETKPLTLGRRNRLVDMYVLSPFVWRDGTVFRILLRAVPRRDDEPRLKMAEIWHGASDDGLHFEMDAAPVIFPGPELTDLDGCEDPTVLVAGGRLRVWYTGWNQQQQTGCLLLARGDDVAKLAKAGLALPSRAPFSNPKEASVALRKGAGARLYFEYADHDASLIGQADADDLDGPWGDVAQSPLQPRPEAWDAWHLSPGPLVGVGGGSPVMFYNGATQSAEWRIGWVRFDAKLERVVERSADPLIEPDEHSGAATDIAFAASAVEMRSQTWLYYSQSDQNLRRAVLKGGPA